MFNFPQIVSCSHSHSNYHKLGQHRRDTQHGWAQRELFLSAREFQTFHWPSRGFLDKSSPNWPWALSTWFEGSIDKICCCKPCPLTSERLDDSASLWVWQQVENLTISQWKERIFDHDGYNNENSIEKVDKQVAFSPKQSLPQTPNNLFPSDEKSIK